MLTRLWCSLALVFAVTIGMLTGAESAASSVPAAVVDSASIDHMVDTFNPNVWTPTRDGQKLVLEATNVFTSPASDVARRTRDLTWLTVVVFIPFLILPLILLLYVIFKFRDRGDGRPVATFMGNHKLEIIWTAIPVLALFLVVYPLWVVLDFMESPPEGGPDPLVITVIGKSFAWDYEYKGLWKDPNAKEKQSISLGQDIVGQQEAVILPKGRPVVMNFTSNDVNHAWWVPAFGVKRDCIQGRFTRAWFTPDTVGPYKGQCVELCGHGHGIMLISSAVVEESDFAQFITLSRFRDDTRGVWTALTANDQASVSKAIDKFLAKNDSSDSRLALRYWVASNYASSLRFPQGDFAKLPINERNQLVAQRRKMVDDLLTAAAVSGPATAPLPN